jgi:DNA-binding MarR family transcriptional regulator
VVARLNASREAIAGDRNGEEPLPRKSSPADGKTSNGEAVDYGPLAHWAGFNLRMAQAAAFQAFARLAKDVGSRPGRFATLMLIGRNPGISQTTLSRANGRDKSTLTPVLNDLERRGLVRRQRTRADQRVYRLTLTPAGRKLLRQLVACAEKHEKNLDRIIGRGQQAAFVRTLRRIAAEM